MLSDYQIQANAFYVDVTSSNDGWGHLIGTKRNQASASDNYIAKALGGPNQDNIINIAKKEEPSSTFDIELKNAKKFIKDNGVIGAFQPEKFLYSKKEVEN